MEDVSVFPSRQAEIRPRMFPASGTDRQGRRGLAAARPPADSHSFYSADYAWNDLDPACPRCGDLCHPADLDCPACGTQLYPTRSQATSRNAFPGARPAAQTQGA